MTGRACSLCQNFSRRILLILLFLITFAVGSLHKFFSEGTPSEATSRAIVSPALSGGKGKSGQRRAMHRANSVGPDPDEESETESATENNRRLPSLPIAIGIERAGGEGENVR